jgi:acetyltransferase-like isoleucine patch superfamily enzyme
VIDSFALKVRRAETPFYRFLRSVVLTLRTGALPVPRFIMPFLRLLFTLSQSGGQFWRGLLSFLWWTPLFRSRCAHVGNRFFLARLPFVVGHTEIRIGDDVNFFGKVDIFSGRMLDKPLLILGDRVDIGAGVTFVVNKEVIIEDDVNVASGVRFMDSDAHPRDAAERIADLPPRIEEIKSVRIGRYAWIGQNSFVLKGVTIGEGAVVGVNSVVVSDIPEYCVAMGNPARVVVKNLKRVTPLPKNPGGDGTNPPVTNPAVTGSA